MIRVLFIGSGQTLELPSTLLLLLTSSRHTVKNIFFSIFSNILTKRQLCYGNFFLTKRSGLTFFRSQIQEFFFARVESVGPAVTSSANWYLSQDIQRPIMRCTPRAAPLPPTPPSAPQCPRYIVYFFLSL